MTTDMMEREAQRACSDLSVLAQRMDARPQIDKLAAALAKAQGEFPAIPRNREVKVTMKSGGSYTFKYAPLDTILECVRPCLSANGLALTSLVVDGKVRTMLLHESGQSLEHSIPMGDVENIQGLGSELTYLRRYGVTCILCLAPDEDDDGNAACGNGREITERTPRGKKPPPAPAANQYVDGARKAIANAETVKRLKEVEAKIHDYRKAGQISDDEATELDKLVLAKQDALHP